LNAALLINKERNNSPVSFITETMVACQAVNFICCVAVYGFCTLAIPPYQYYRQVSYLFVPEKESVYHYSYCCKRTKNVQRAKA
jgi:hypothetical protein